MARQVSEQRRKLGAALRTARLRAGLPKNMTVRDIAELVGISPATASRIELGTTRPLSVGQINAWADATNADEETRALLLAYRDAAATELIEYRPGDSAAHQEDVNRIQAVARTVRNFQPVIVPGLLQTPDYSAAIFTLADPTTDVATAVALRRERQAELYGQRKRFTFLMLENALRWNPDTGTLAAQLRFLSTFATVPSVSLRVIPQDAIMKVPPVCGFILYDNPAGNAQPLVVVEIPDHSEVIREDPADVQGYRNHLDLLTESALDEADSYTLIAELASRLSE